MRNINSRIFFQSNTDGKIGYNQLSMMRYWSLLSVVISKTQRFTRLMTSVRVILYNTFVLEETKLRTLHHSNMKTHAYHQRITNENIERKTKAMNPSLCTPAGTNQVTPPKTSFLPICCEKNCSTANSVTPNNITPSYYLPSSNIKQHSYKH